MNKSVVNQGTADEDSNSCDSDNERDDKTEKAPIDKSITVVARGKRTAVEKETSQETYGTSCNDTDDEPENDARDKSKESKVP